MSSVVRVIAVGLRRSILSGLVEGEGVVYLFVWREDGALRGC